MPLLAGWAISVLCRVDRPSMIAISAIYKLQESLIVSRKRESPLTQGALSKASEKQEFKMRPVKAKFCQLP